MCRLFFAVLHTFRCRFMTFRRCKCKNNIFTDKIIRQKFIEKRCFFFFFQ